MQRGVVVEHSNVIADHSRVIVEHSNLSISCLALLAALAALAMHAPWLALLAVLVGVSVLWRTALMAWVVLATLIGGLVSVSAPLLLTIAAGAAIAYVVSTAASLWPAFAPDTTLRVPDRLQVAVRPASTCRLTQGFAKLQMQTGASIVGECVDGELFNPATNTMEQHTTNGLLVWRKLENVTAFTDGYTSWLDGPRGLERRQNNQRFCWEADAIRGRCLP